MPDTPYKLSPLFDVIRQSGGQFLIQGGWQVSDSWPATGDEPVSLRQGVYLVDESHRCMIIVHGDRGGQVIETLDINPPQLIGYGVVADHLSVYRLRPDQLFINTQPGVEQEIMDRLTNSLPAKDQMVTLTDVTHGRFQLRLVGPASSRVLGRICGIDFHPEHFPNLTAVQTSVAKTPQLIIREDVGEVISFSIIGARSLAGYLWTILIDSGQDYGIKLAGQQLIRALHSPGKNQSPVNSE
jgi:heterotetrameric sarcosine oxidase gamma subunit